MKFTRKSIGRIAATFVATAMLATMAIVPASADTGDKGVTGPNTGISGTEGGSSFGDNNTFTIQKKLNVQDKSYTPNVTFNFTVTPVTQANLTAADKSNNIYPGVDNGVVFVSGATFTTGTTTGGSPVENATFRVNMGTEEEPTFTHAGVYKYTVQEQGGNYKGVTYNTTDVKDLYVYIVNTDNGLAVSYTELVDSDGAKTNQFTNTYGDTTTDKEILNNLELKKVISGDGADLTAKFAFSVKVDGDEDIPNTAPEGEESNAKLEQFLVEFSDDTPSITLTSGEARTIYLGNNVTATIYGLSEDDTYTITEANVSAQDNVAKTTDGYTVTVTGGTDNDSDHNGSVTGKIENDTTVQYENSKGASTPTGIVMDIAPYALLVIVAGAACFIFLRKRNKD